MVDTAQVLFERMTQTATALFALVGVRVYEDRLPAGFKNTTSAIIFDITTETNEDSKEVISGVFMARCFGGSDNQDAAKAIYRALNDQMDDVTNSIQTSGTIIRCKQLAKSKEVNPDQGWLIEKAAFSFIIE